jgi:hypothetical protein
MANDVLLHRLLAAEKRRGPNPDRSRHISELLRGRGQTEPQRVADAERLMMAHRQAARDQLLKGPPSGHPVPAAEGMMRMIYDRGQQVAAARRDRAESQVLRAQAAARAERVQRLVGTRPNTGLYGNPQKALEHVGRVNLNLPSSG